ncbi:MAG TPA: HD domain-containing phosphohydrolase [Acidimicrobiales bacterium]|nr:HD domain-containing phosphohydrolase [Acidimicrobiales bacterium]
MNPANAQSGAHVTLHRHVFSSDFANELRTGLLIFDANGIAVDCNKAALELLAASRTELVGHNSTAMPLKSIREDGSVLPLNEHASARALSTGQPCYGIIMGIDNSGRSRRWLSVDGYPVIEDGRIQGAIVIFDDVSAMWKQRHALRLLNEVNQIVMLATDEIDPLQHLCEALVKYGPYALAWVGFASSQARGRIDIAFSSGTTDYLREGMASWSKTDNTGHGPVGTALRTGTIQVVNDLDTDQISESWRARARQFDLGSCTAIPFTVAGQVAVLGVYDQHAYTFDETTVQGLESIMRETEFGLAHRQSTNRLAKALDGTLAALGQMIETRDPYTAGHQFHVGTLGAALAAALAIEYGLDPAMVELIRQSGEVHDIGKIAVPSEILTKPGRLSRLEYEMVKRHPQIGYDILSKASLPWPIAEVALQHHERMDGSGYPNGLKGNDIVLPARIVAVADVVEAMTQHRPYREGLGLDRALAEVAAGAGTLFDPDIVACCQSVFDRGFAFAPEPTVELTRVTTE